MKKIIVIIILALAATTGYAAGPYKYEFEIVYNHHTLNLSGSYFGSFIPIQPNENTFQTPNKNVVDSVRNIMTASSLKDYDWFKDHSIDMSKQDVKDLIAEIYDNDFQMRGFIIFKNYAIVLARKGPTKQRFILVLKRNKYNDNYYLDNKFKDLYSTHYKIFNNAFNRKGQFKVMKKF